MVPDNLWPWPDLGLMGVGEGGWGSGGAGCMGKAGTHLPVSAGGMAAFVRQFCPCSKRVMDAPARKQDLRGASVAATTDVQ